MVAVILPQAQGSMGFLPVAGEANLDRHGSESTAHASAVLFLFFFVGKEAGRGSPT